MDITYESLKPEIDLEIAEAKRLFDERLSDNSELLSAQIADVEAHHYRVSTLLTQAEEVLAFAKDFNLPERERKCNEFDKKIIIAAKVAKEQALVSVLERLLGSIERRIQTAQSLLAYAREICKIGGRGTT